ncbi:MAG: hypothetical protein WC763_02110 [Candidatus Paceibacterota bacterium]
MSGKFFIISARFAKTEGGQPVICHKLTMFSLLRTKMVENITHVILRDGTGQIVLAPLASINPYPRDVTITEPHGGYLHLHSFEVDFSDLSPRDRLYVLHGDKRVEFPLSIIEVIQHNPLRNSVAV